MVTPRLIAIDIDGTLLNSSFQVSERNLQTLQQAHEQGVDILLATGRRHAFALPVAQALGFPAALISSNGAVTRDAKGELFFRDPLPLGAVREMIAHMTKFRANLVITYDNDGEGILLLETLEELNQSIRRWLEKNAHCLKYVSPIEDGLAGDPIQAMFCGTVERMAEAQEQLRKNPSLLTQITILRTQYDERNLCLLDILNRGCTKGAALKRGASARGYRREEVMAIGDNYNDVEMLAFAGQPWIMGNATSDLRERGYQTTLGNDENGVALAIEKVLDGF